MAIGLVLLGLLAGAVGVVMAISSQARGVRSAQAALFAGRVALELAESAVDEAVSELGPLFAAQVGKRDLLAHYRAVQIGGFVPGPEVVGAPALAYPPALTRALVRENEVAVELSDVTVVPLTYAIVQNHGQVELSCRASLKTATGRVIHRRVTARHYIVLDPDGRSLRVNPLADSYTVDREGE
jgi:hypothetical protein